MILPNQSRRTWICGFLFGVITVAGISGIIFGISKINQFHPIKLPWRAAPHPLHPAYLVIPTPKSLTVSGAPMIVTDHTCLVVADDATEQDKAAVEAVQRELAVRFGIHALPVITESAAAKSNEPRIIFGEPKRMPGIRHALAAAHAAAPPNPEGYCIRVTPQYTVVAGRDPAGTFYGAQTLCQLLTRAGAKVTVPGVQVDDYPSLPWRGAHLFLGNKALPFHKRLITNVFARYKMNNLVLQCEQAKWKTLGKIAPDWAMSKQDLSADIAYARAHFLSVTPLVESVGHMGWVLKSKPADWSEDSKTGYAANVTNPAVDRFLFDLYDEVLNTFHSPVLHIGADEAMFRGAYPGRSKAKYPRLGDVYLAEVIKLHNHLRARHIDTMLWADTLLGPGEAPDAALAPTLAEAERIRTSLPTDIQLCDWHYAVSDAYSSPSLLRGAGFGGVIGATWYDPHNIQAFAHSLAVQRQRGLLQTTWCGYESSEKNLVHDRNQFVAFVIAAEEAWNGGTIVPEDLPYDPSKVFDTSYGLPLVEAGGRP